MALTRPRRFEGQVRGVSHHGQETHLHKQAGYIDADFLHPPTFPLQSDGGPYIGPLVATAFVASIGNGAAFRKGREFAACMGLVPKQYSTGGKTKLYGISKRGNRYLRKILIHGARAVVLRSKRDRIAMGAWMTALEARAPRNVLIVAVANKLARIAWAVLSSGQDYRAVQEPIAA